jgi:hypothetical protein
MAHGKYDLIEFSDPYTVRESEQTMQAVLDNRRTQAPLRLLVDVRHSQPPETAFVQNAATFWRQHLSQMDGARIAVLVATDAQFGMARMSEIYTEQMPFRLRAFRDLAQAEEWLTMP